MFEPKESLCGLGSQRWVVRAWLCICLVFKTLGAAVFAEWSIWTITSCIRASDLANLLHEIEDLSLLYPIQQDKHVYR